MHVTYTQTPASLSPMAWLFIVGVASAAFLLLIVLPAFVMIRADRHRRFGLGSLLPRVDSAWAMASVCVAIGAGVPFLAFGFTWLAHSRPGVSDAIWVAPGVVGGLSVIAASLLAGYLFRLGARQGRPTQADGWEGKPAGDPDAFDVVGRRG